MKAIKLLWGFYCLLALAQKAKLGKEYHAAATRWAQRSKRLLDRRKGGRQIVSKILVEICLSLSHMNLAIAKGLIPRLAK